ncbi:MAG: ATP-binding protein [Gammaproteobacteria bacterium]|nr:ATP-binding protein [Gammaproteobacteria bacterium]
MDNLQINQALIAGDISTPGVLPHLDGLKTVQYVFETDFGLDSLPNEPGVIMVRGPRQYGKSTWLEQQIANTIKEFGPGSALYLNGDEIIDRTFLTKEVRVLIQLFNPKSKVKRLFIDEITAIEQWEKSIKRLLDAGELKDILLVTTGSKASDLRRGSERLPGRKGKLNRTNYIFTPISYQEFLNKCSKKFNKESLLTYILSGGSPVGINAIAETGRLPDYVISIISDWILGEFTATGRSRSNLLAVLETLYRMTGNPVGQAKLARESGLSNNTMAQGYIDLLRDLLTVIPSFPLDTQRDITLFRKPCKYHFINLLVAICWHPQKPRTVNDLIHLDSGLGAIYEWTVAQELWRRTCISSSHELSEHMNFWQTSDHEIDFVLPEIPLYLEVKSGNFHPTNFIWFLKSFIKGKLIVINKNRFETERIIGITLEDFLLSSN